MNPLDKKTVIIVLGPTASGKTGLSLLLAKALKTEIISADSMQVYRHMDIGTAKPSIAEMEEVPHHLINILPPDQAFSAGMFREMAVKIIEALHMKNKIPVIAGGTGLYIRALTRGLFEGPAADWSLREKLNKDAEEFGNDYLHKYLSSIDPAAAEKINPNDLRRTIRAIEVAGQGSGTMSELQPLSTKPEAYDFIKIGLFREREELYRLIDERVDRMLEKGLLDETEELLKMSPDRTAIQAIGYRELMLHLQGQMEFNEAVRLIKKHSRMYAKRQFTWFNKEPDIKWIDVTGLMDPQEIFEKAVNEVEILRELIYP